MGGTRLTYALVTPARDEADNLRRLADSVLAQTIPPTEWIIVDDGSADETPAVAGALAHEHGWIRELGSPGAQSRDGAMVDGRLAGRDVLAFKSGVAALDQPPDVVVKLDADVSIAPDYFERLLAAFDADPTLGIASGTCLEYRREAWRPQHVIAAHVRGATRAYRRQCFEEVSPLEERLGWDGIDELRANLRGWKTQTLLDLPFYHHRLIGSREGARVRAFVRQGLAAYFMGYRASYLVLRSLFHAQKEPAALAMMWGYVSAAARREPRLDDSAVRGYLQRRQSMRSVHLRMLEVLGKRPAA
jgi:biofilm PGA synthesis N-glycosyltransferase PgaC